MPRTWRQCVSISNKPFGSQTKSHPQRPHDFNRHFHFEFRVIFQIILELFVSKRKLQMTRSKGSTIPPPSHTRITVFLSRTAGDGLFMANGKHHLWQKYVKKKNKYYSSHILGSPRPALLPSFIVSLGIGICRRSSRARLLLMPQPLAIGVG